MLERKYGNDKVLELIVELGGRASFDGIIGLAKTKRSPLDKTKIWDRLISLSRKGLVKNESGVWIITSSKASEHN